MQHHTRAQIVEALKESVSRRGAEVLIVIPTYNEVDNVPELIKRIDQNVKARREILVIDDGSPDGTADVAQALAATIQGVHIFRRAGKQGLGSAYVAGFGIAIEVGFPYVLTMDADLSHDPIVINDLMAKIPSNDLVIGSRYCPGGDIPNFELWRRWMSKGGNLLAKALLGVKAKDCTSGFRCYRTSVLKDLKIENNIKSKQYIFLVELLLWMTMNKCRIDEAPIIFNQRTKGKTKVSATEFLHALEKVFVLCFQVRILKKKTILG